MTEEKKGVSNPVWDACVEALGYEPATESELKLWGRMTTSLRRAGADRDKIIAVAEFYHRSWPDLDLTITALEKWYSHFLRLKVKREKRQAVCDECEMGGGFHRADCSHARRT